MMLAADLDIWRYQFHPEVWLIVAAGIGFGFYATRVIGPKVVPAGESVVTAAQKRYFGLAMFLLWLASDWPMHDISEEYLYSVHMVQHLLITLVVPPLLLLAIPEWLARLVVSSDGESGTWVRRWSRPVVAGLLFNVIVAFTHLTWVVNTSIEVGLFHYFVHLVVFVSALLMWQPVVSPLPELRVTPPGQVIYLFLMSVLPTVPGAFLTFAEGALYEVYDHDVRLWGLDITSDQQGAGLIMKLGGGTYLWIIIAFVFFRWAGKSEDRTQGTIVRRRTSDDDGRPVSELTYEQVQQAFESSPPAGDRN